MANNARLPAAASFSIAALKEPDLGLEILGDDSIVQIAFAMAPKLVTVLCQNAESCRALPALSGGADDRYFLICTV